MIILKFLDSRVWLSVLFLPFYGTLSAAAGRIHVIPEPVSVTEKPGSFNLRQGATVVVDGDSTAGVTAWFIQEMRDQTGISLREEKGGRGAITVHVGINAANGREGYSLAVTGSGIRIRAGTAGGGFYGGRTVAAVLSPG